jgi:acyl-CoA synthetase (AMP-forming)/AMP-acid ligase II
MGAPVKQESFPNDSFFNEIVSRAKLSSSDDWYIHDPANNIKVTYTQLLQDVLKFKATLRNLLSVGTVRALDSSNEKTALNFFIFAPSGYYFLVAFLAVLALGGVAVPLGKCSDAL